MTTRQKWNKYIACGFNGDNIDYYNNLIMEIEQELPFKNEKEHQKWLDMGMTWTGEIEWLRLTEKILERLNTHAYRIGLKMDTTILINGEPYELPKDYWLTMKKEPNENERFLKIEGRNLMQAKLALEILKNVKLRYHIDIDLSDIVVE